MLTPGNQDRLGCKRSVLFEVLVGCEKQPTKKREQQGGGNCGDGGRNERTNAKFGRMYEVNHVAVGV